jgi:hypothetical protein
MVDTGAEADFVSRAVVERLGIPIIPTKESEAVRARLPEGTLLTSPGFALLPLTIDGMRITRPFVVLDIEHEIILGCTFLEQYQCDMLHRPRVMIARKDDGCYTIPFVEPDSTGDHAAFSTIRAKHVNKLIKSKNPDYTCYTAWVHFGDGDADAAATAGAPPQSRALTAVALTEGAQPTPTPAPTATLTFEDGTVEPITGDKEVIELIRPALEKRLFLFGPPKAGPKRPGCESIEHVITLKPSAEPVRKAPYRNSQKELDVMKKALEEAVEAGFIVPSRSAWASPVIFVSKKDTDELRMCVDYRAVNERVVRDAHPLPHIDRLLDQLYGAKYFAKFDRRHAFHQIPIRKEDRHITAFTTRYGLYEYTVLPFGLSNAPAECQRLMNEVLGDYNDTFCSIYMDDCLAWGRTKEELAANIVKILERFETYDLRLKLSKCAFGLTSVLFLGHVVSDKGIPPDPSKVKAVNAWPRPKAVRDVQQFLGFANYCRRFIPNFSHNAKPLNALVSSKVPRPFSWGTVHQHGFDRIKRALVSTPCLLVPKPGAPYVLYTDASNFALGAALYQDQGDGLQPIAYYSRKMEDRELRYSAMDKELLAVDKAITFFRVYIHGVDTTLKTDHKNVVYLVNSDTSAITCHRQARTVDKVWSYRPHLKVEYVPGAKNRADALSRILAEDGEDRVSDPALSAITAPRTDIRDDIAAAYAHGPSYSYPAWIARHKLVKRDSLWYYGSSDRIAVPCATTIRQTIMRAYHDHPASGHFGVAKTYDTVAERFWWEHMKRTVEGYVAGREACTCSKSSTQKRPGLMHPMPIPKRVGEVITMDLLTGLPQCEGHDAVVVFVCKLSKFIKAVPISKSITGEELGRVFIAEVLCTFGSPAVVISDRDPRMMSGFWKQMFDERGIKHTPSSAYHPQTDGQSERAIRTFEDALRAFVNPRQDDWVECLKWIEFAYNRSMNLTTRAIPYEVAFRFVPPHPFDIVLGTTRTPLTRTEHEQLIDKTRANIELAQRRQKHYHDKKYRPLTFQVGEYAYIPVALGHPPATGDHQARAQLLWAVQGRPQHQGHRLRARASARHAPHPPGLSRRVPQYGALGRAAPQSRRPPAVRGPAGRRRCSGLHLRPPLPIQPAPVF